MSAMSENHSQWQKWVIAQEKSGMAQKKFCAKNGISHAKFAYYRGLFKTKPTAPEKPDTIKSAVLPIKIQHTQENANHDANVMRLSLQNGMQCILPCNIDLKRLQQLLGVLLSC